jgi:hypothetical protein
LPAQCSHEVEIVCPINPPSLVVQTRAEPKSDCRFALNPANRYEKAPIELEVVGGDRVHLGCRIRTPDETVGTPSGALAHDDNDFPSTRGPFALHAQKASVKVEDHVVAPSFRNRLVNPDPELRCGKLNG